MIRGRNMNEGKKASTIEYVEVVYNGREKREKVKPDSNRCVCVDSVMSVVCNLKDSRKQAMSDEVYSINNWQKLLTRRFYDQAPGIFLFIGIPLAYCYYFKLLQLAQLSKF